MGIFVIKRAIPTFKLRPLNADEVKTKPLNGDQSDTAIIIQGPYLEDDDFTFETLKLYKSFFPKCLIIFSTWKGINDQLEEKIVKLGIELLILIPPTTPEEFMFDKGANIDLQSFGVSKAIEVAIQKEKQFVVKSRADCRIYNPNFIDYCKGLLEIYKTPRGSNRIVSIDSSTIKSRPYSLGDIFQFGEILEMQNFWKYKPWESELKELFHDKKVVNSTPIVAEIFLTSRYLMKKGHKLDFTILDWFYHLKNEFIVIDSDDIDHIFYKYNSQYEVLRNRYFSITSKEVSHLDWLLIYQNKISNVKENTLEIEIDALELTKDKKIKKIRK